MAVIKISNKDIIEKIQSKLTLQLGRRFTQQDVVDLCVDYAQDNLEELIGRASNLPRLTPERVDQILKEIENLPDIPYDTSLSIANENDRDIYSL
ncbi:MAG: hypothetical protein ACTSRK_08195 [Promethearchaeota archaeon]